MTLHVQTARITYSGPHRLDITRSGGSPFGPSWRVLNPALKARRRAKLLRERGEQQAADRLIKSSWATYEDRYREEMRTLYRTRPEVWTELLARDRVVLVCYCTDRFRCHRRLLAGYLESLGAVYEGEA